MTLKVYELSGMNIQCKWLVAFLLIFCGFVCQAQTQALIQEADRQLELRAYGRSIDLYTQLLTELNNALTSEQRISVRSNLALSYKSVGDLQKAENTYRELINSSELSGDKINAYLQFAQVLASNGKYRESQSMYEKYNSLKGRQAVRDQIPISSPTAPALVNGKKPVVKYRLEVLEMNTSNAEFSPMYFRDGLIYISGKKGGSAIETSGSGGGGGYLDLFYIPDRRLIKVSKIINPDGTVAKAAAASKKDRRRGNGSRASANDSRSIGGYINVTGDLGYGKAAKSGQRFSKELNTRYHEGPATFSSDGSRIVFTRNNYNEGRVRQSTEGVTNLKLYTAEQQSGNWVNIKELPFNSNEYSVGHPALSRDDQWLVFASDMPGGYGGTDLYIVQFQGGKWGKPVNLGAQINTKGNELFPFIDENGNLYFSSDGRRGLGGLDIYFALMKSPTQVELVDHLDAPINSDQDDFGLITDGLRRTGYFSTNRFNGSDDILRFSRQSSLYGCRNLTLRLYNDDNNQPLDSVVVEIQEKGDGKQVRKIVTKADGLIQLCLEPNNDFVFKSSKDGFITSTIGFSTRSMLDDSPSRLEIALFEPKEVSDTVSIANAKSPSESDNDGWGPVNVAKSHIRGVVMSEGDRKPIEGVTVRLRGECDGLVQTVQTGPDGRYEFELSENCGYTLVATKERYGTNMNRINKLPKPATPKVLSADLRMLRVGDIVQLDNIYYDLDKWNIRPDAARELDKLVATMRKYPSLNVEIRSHTDSRGDNNYNKYLSAQRANSVVNYLVYKGIARKRCVAAGYGESMPVNNCVDGVNCTEEEYQRNRRTEFKVLSIR
ncbi:OmpA family protein [Tellurirhabdus bombi]|uniref:OmpA family protein n=1 Tax=Tellurirhabdus bombi TaxID=2907205 RepID=UPI001F2599A4|nr:OmpA family protein [Tellurirhabdus bombi]